MRFAFFGSSLLSSYWNGAATYYRGILRALHQRGHQIVFYEPDAYDRQSHRDIEAPCWAQVVVYDASEEAACRALAAASDADVIVKASGVGILDDLLEAGVAALKRPSNHVLFWDVDAPATLDRLRLNPADSLAGLIPKFDAVFTYGGGAPVMRAYTELRARCCLPVYNALDPDFHFQVEPDPRFTADLAFLGNRLPDREARVDEFFLAPAQRLGGSTFLLGGRGMGNETAPPQREVRQPRLHSRSQCL